MFYKTDLKVCIGTSCHVHGSEKVVRRLQHLIKEYDLAVEVSLQGKLCMSRCSGSGVQISFGDAIYETSPEKVDSFFEHVVLGAHNNSTPHVQAVSA